MNRNIHYSDNINVEPLFLTNINSTSATGKYYWCFGGYPEKKRREEEIMGTEYE